MMLKAAKVLSCAFAIMTRLYNATAILYNNKFPPTQPISMNPDVKKYKQFMEENRGQTKIISP